MYRNLTSSLIVLICPAKYKGSSSLNLTLPELDYKNLFLFLLMAGTQHPTPLDFLNVSLKIDSPCLKSSHYSP